MTILLLLPSFIGCTYESEEDLYPKNFDSCQPEVVSFQIEIRPIIQTNCAIPGCHVPGGTGFGLFANYAGVKAKVDNGSLRQRVLDLKDMPPVQPLTDYERLLIAKWLDTGAPDN